MSQGSSPASSPKAEVIHVHIAARLVNCTPRTIRRKIQTGVLIAERDGQRRWAIRRSDLERFAAKRRQNDQDSGRN